MERMHYNVEPLRTDQEIDDFLWLFHKRVMGSVIA